MDKNDQQPDSKKKGDNKLSQSELLDVFSFNSSFDIQVVKDTINQVDKNGDGFLRFDEFTTLMQAMDF